MCDGLIKFEMDGRFWTSVPGDGDDTGGLAGTRFCAWCGCVESIVAAEADTRVGAGAGAGVFAVETEAGALSGCSPC